MEVIDDRRGHVPDAMAPSDRPARTDSGTPASTRRRPRRAGV
jgi:hypothetical protein